MLAKTQRSYKGRNVMIRDNCGMVPTEKASKYIYTVHIYLFMEILVMYKKGL